MFTRGKANAAQTLQRRLFFLAKRFVAGETIASAIEAVRSLNEQGMTATVDVLGEAIGQMDEVERTRETYIALLDAISGAGVDANVSLKLSALGLSFDEEACSTALRSIALHARRGADDFVRIDMEGSALTQRTLDLFEKTFVEQHNIGPVIQAYLKRTPADVERMIELGARVRLCKGAYREPRSIALHDPTDIRRSFLRCAEMLLARGNYPAFATHDPLLIEAVRSFARVHAIAPARFEFQMLYGVRTDLQAALALGGYTVRIYVPFGKHWARYFLRRVAERRENALFALRALLAHTRPR